MTSFAEILHQRTHDLPQDVLARPFLEIAVACLIGRVTARQRVPLRPGAKHPKDPVEHLAAVLARSAAAIPAPPIAWQQRLNELPLGIREVHSDIP